MSNRNSHRPPPFAGEAIRTRNSRGKPAIGNRGKRWIYKRPGTDLDVRYQARIGADLREHKVHAGVRPDDGEFVTTRVWVTRFSRKMMHNVGTPADSSGKGP